MVLLWASLGGFGRERSNSNPVVAGLWCSVWLDRGLDAVGREAMTDDDDTQEYAHQRQWVGLTDEEIEQGCKESWVTEQAWQSAVWWAEKKLKEKNT